MNAPKKLEEIDPELFGGPYPNHGEPPLPIPRFGKAGPSKVVSLADLSSQKSSDPFDSPFLMEWNDVGLGVRAEFRLEPGPDGLEMVAYVTSRPELQGFELVLGIDAAEEIKFRHRTITLLVDEHQVCGGRVSFGPVAEVQAKFGDHITAEGFLLEPPCAANCLPSQS